jgi:hypothetical protein
MHVPDRGRHLRNRADVFDHELVRQKSLIDQLHDPVISRLQPDRSEMLPAYFHASAYIDIHFEAFKYRIFN